MALNNNYERYMKLAGRGIMIVLAVSFLVFNAFKFYQYAAANPAQIWTYHSAQDPFSKYRNPAIGVYFFPANTEKDVKPVMLVLPRNLENIAKPARDIINLEMAQAKQTAIVVENEILPQALPLNDKKHRFSALSYKNREAEKLQENVENLIRNGALIIWFEEMENSASKGFSLIKNVAKSLNLRPEAFDLLQAGTASAVFKTISKPEKISLDEQEENLRQFRKDYHTQLGELYRHILGNETETLVQTEKNRHLWDKGSVFVLAQDRQNGTWEEFGKMRYNRPLAEEMQHALQEAREAFPDAHYRTFLITGTQEKSYAQEAAFLADLHPGKDGILLVDGSRKKVFLPSLWEIYSEKKEFVKQLKIKSGLSPDYWSEKIKVYYFRAVEIIDNEN